MKFRTFDIDYRSLLALNQKNCYSVGETDVTRRLIDLSKRTDDSICLGFGSGDKLFGIAGSLRNWEGVSQLWAVFDGEVDKYPIALTKMCNELILFAVQEQRLKRVSLTVRSEYTKGNQFAGCLGFNFEGKMHKFFPDGDDANLYARLF